MQEPRLEDEAERLRAQAMKLPAGDERERLLERADEIERTSRMVHWINSPGLRPPTRKRPRLPESH
jgi:hypothetical protein